MRNLIIFYLFLAGFQYVNAEGAKSYLSSEKPFLLIEDVNHQAEAWGTCAAAYEVTAMFLDSQSARARQVMDLSNGARIAVAMTHVANGLEPDISTERFHALWNFSKTLADSIPETKKNMMLADAETFGQQGSEQFLESIGSTMKICMDNLDGQQSYIEMWRELAKSGLLQFPVE